ncbi:GlcG/HbpS family heme-binding protein [Marinomonas sp. PE14-40]|uniref:GlcG/HbpS family heme-binding protein n=1 Tax=Marinomonas sp. PE14-40 TaxID=3060621 RepID=UPI003F67A858
MKSIIKQITGVSLVLMSGLATAQESEQTHTFTQLSSSTAISLAVAGVSECAKDNYNVTTTVVDLAGRVLVQLRNNNATTHTLESSRQKAFTAVSMKQPTANLMKLIQDKPVLRPLQNMDENLLFLAGGIPLKINDQIVGGIGIGGAPGGHLDVACAEAAIKRVMK